MWIEDYRKQHGLELDQFARKVNHYGHTRMTPRMACTITDTLVHMLERDKNCVTHPIIANAIAEYCGATQEQRDMIVADIHKGNWSPRKEADYVAPPVYSFNNARNGARPVVKINMRGEVIAAFESVTDAARREQISEEVIRKRCQRRAYVDFTVDMPYTYRYQSEWLEMSRYERWKDITAKGEVMV